MITRLLVANRGEIARRVFATCRGLGIATAAVFSDPDAGSPHVAEADVAVRLPGAAAAQTYLNGPGILAAARACGADAVHPGYGFLAEDPRFAQSVLDAGLTWIGPPPEAMTAMALKIAARQTAAAAGIPVLPELDPAAVTEFPVLVKASAGGGGRGMREVRSAAELGPALESAGREAQAAFGDGTLYCEPLLTGARHVEVQVLADGHGTVWVLTERDCSVQRRYAKVIEESPSPAVDPGLRERLLSAASALSRAVGYVGAGTVEFLVAEDDYFFLEFNTRLQVEHPVTECLHGIDLVALQISVAEGRPLPPVPPSATGHAIEARLYAEDPGAGFRPTAGVVHRFDVGYDCVFASPTWLDRPYLRLDSGIGPGADIPPHYDALLAKLIAWAPSRAGAARRLAGALAGARIAGPPTNRDLLVGVLRDQVFAAGQATTAYLDEYDVAALSPDERTCELSALAAAVAVAAGHVRSSIPGGFRNVWSQPQRTAFGGPGGRLDIAYRWTRSGGIEPVDVTDAAVISVTPDSVILEVAGVSQRFDVTRVNDELWVDSPLGSVRLALLDRLPAPAALTEPGSLLAPMPGNVVRIEAAVGDRVSPGQVIAVIEAMKMEHQVTSPSAGVLAEIRVSAGGQVNAGDLLAVVKPDTAEPEESR